MARRLSTSRARASSSGQDLESVVLQQVRDYLRLRGWYVIRIQQSLGSHRGLSDLICVKEGRTVFLECKTATGRLSPDQQGFQEAIRASGGEYVVARCLEDVMEL